MTAVWTAPRTWANNELVDQTIMNQHIRDNMDWLKTRPQGAYIAPAALGITSTVFADILTPITITSSGGPFLAGFFGTVSMSAAIGVNSLNLDVLCDGVQQGGSVGVASFHSIGAGLLFNASFVMYVPAKVAGSHTWKMQAKVNAGSATIYAISAGLTTGFWVREI